MTASVSTRAPGTTAGDIGAAGFKHVINASIRIPAALANIAALSFLGEGCFRGVNLAKSVLFQVPYSDIFTSSNSASMVSRAITLIRPYGAIAAEGGSYLLSHRDLAVAAGVTVGASMVLTEIASRVAGEPPAIYNKVMSLIGPFRISSDSIFTSWGNLFSSQSTHEKRT